MSQERMSPAEELDLVRQTTNRESPVTSSLRIESFGVESEVAAVLEAEEPERFIPAY